MDKFCPECGKTQGSFLKGFCFECYLKKHDLISVEPEIVVEECKACEKVKFKGKLLDQTDDLVKEIKKIVDANKGASFGVVMGKAMAQFRGKVDGKKVAEIVKLSQKGN